MGSSAASARLARHGSRIGSRHAVTESAYRACIGAMNLYNAAPCPFEPFRCELLQRRGGLERSASGAMIPGLPESGPLFNNLSQATCVGARKSNSARAPLVVAFATARGARKSSQSLCLFALK